MISRWRLLNRRCPPQASSQGVLLPIWPRAKVEREVHRQSTERRYPAQVSLSSDRLDLNLPSFTMYPKKRLGETRKAKFFGRLHDLTHQWSHTNHSLEYARSPWMSCANDLHGVECSSGQRNSDKDNSGTELLTSCSAASYPALPSSTFLLVVLGTALVLVPAGCGCLDFLAAGQLFITNTRAATEAPGASQLQENSLARSIGSVGDD